MQANSSSGEIDPQLSQAALDTAVVAAQAAAALIGAASPGLGSLEWIEKGAADFVTEIDRGAEARIAEIIATAFPDAILVAEEMTPEVTLVGEKLTFIVDPLDGTTNFLHGYPQYAVSIGVMQSSELIAAVVLSVARGDLFTARLGHGTYLNGDRVRVSSQSSPARALIGTGFPFKNPEKLDEYIVQFAEVNRRTSGIRRAGSAALDLADVACGRFDGFWELVLAPWDVAAGILLIREAGGIVTDLSGAPSSVSHNSVVAGNPEIHAWLLASLSPPASSLATEARKHGEQRKSF